MGTVIVGIFITGVAGLAAWSLYRNKKRGRCCAGCSGCKGGCLYAESSAGGEQTPPNLP